jgi:hypothetical protein
MGILPDIIVTTDGKGLPLAEDKWFRRVDAYSLDARSLSETNRDEIICANVAALTAALQAADVLPADSTFRVLGCQIDSVDVLLAEVPIRAGEDGMNQLDEPRRLVLLEDKLVRSPEAKRQVLAQILDYAQRAQTQWTTNFLCSDRKLSSHAAWLHRHASRIDVMLAEGDLLLIIAGDDIHDDLLRLARRFAAGHDPLSRNELCLVSMAVYRREEERMLIPHVVSTVERHQRQFTIRVTVEDTDETVLRAKIKRDVEADLESARRGALPINADVEDFLERAKARLNPKLMETRVYTVTDELRKSLEYQYVDDDGAVVRFKVHFGGYKRDIWSPIEVGLYVESKGTRDVWRRRIEEALAAGRLPVGTKLDVRGKQTVSALKEYSCPALFPLVPGARKRRGRLISVMPGLGQLTETAFLGKRPNFSAASRHARLLFCLARPVAATKGEGLGSPRAVSVQLSAVSF